jgi:hypothetical protein
MELWTFINKKTKQLIRCDILDNDPEFGNLYYFLEDEYSPHWFVDSEEKVKLAYNNGFIHPEFCNNFQRPDTQKVNLDDYDIIKFLSKDNVCLKIFNELLDEKNKK